MLDQQVALDHPTERLDGCEEIALAVADLTDTARGECLALLPATIPHSVFPAVAPPGPVRWRGLYQESLRDDPRTIRHARHLADHGGHIRTVPVAPMLLFVVDDRAAVFAVEPRFDHCEGVVLRGAPAAGMRALFEEFWMAARVWGPPAPTEPAALTAQQREVVRLLAEGLTDEGISRRIGVSLRTVRRIASDLMVRLTARSRFEAGVKAAQSGWVE
jgi:DNA-binding CsgD family transcriptional regulator